MLLKKLILHLFGYKEKGKCIGIYYHLVSDDDNDNFLQQMSLLKKLAKPVAGDFSGRLNDEELYVIVTFDDGFQSMLNNVIPMMTKLQIPCTIFIPTFFIGKHPLWDEVTSRENKHHKIMSENEIKNLPSSLFTIGAHSHSHRILPKVTDEEIQMEFIRSKEILETITGREVTLFSFPYGEYDDRLTEIAFRAGFIRLFSIQNKVHYTCIEQFILGRCYVESSDSLLEFKLKIIGAYKWMNTVSKMKKLTKIILNRMAGQKKGSAEPEIEFQLKNTNNKQCPGKLI